MTTSAIAYFRTSSAANVGGDSDTRQREAVQGYANSVGLSIVAEFYDAAVSGADPIDQRPGFSDLLAHAKEHGISTVLVETANRFARSLMVQELGLQMMKREGIQLVAADSPNTFTTQDDPMIEAVRQMLGVMAQLEKALTVAKLKGARDRASEKAGKRIEGRKGYDQTNEALVREAKRLARKSPKTGKARSLRDIATALACLGFSTVNGKAFSPSQVQRLVSYQLT
ncbi:recombinase family protein [Sinorhizobium meliloti]|uniref:recombinase family protein n=1 Tax=Rhizobium meliloti TaxID=382 RepID=UPI000B4A3D89|nr:recombinase family protein [Sinorhizobium meliloti]ASP64627.1 serine recombinase [Sinorhizobium meliloti]MQX05019.1 serine recombinase [Sinorhizobium meliloti]RVG98502.1 recombinase family protein [Sinorhizobium meliloti]RVK47448.1 recombinase family protein [Sinorhizobium meliloti]RVM00707.1 recombinase family protein [Sinorhizobium meliloti]